MYLGAFAWLSGLPFGSLITSADIWKSKPSFRASWPIHLSRLGSCSSIPLFSRNKYVKLWRVVVDCSSPMTGKGSVRTEEAETQAHNYAKYHGGWETPPAFNRPCLEKGLCRELGSIEEECGPPPAGRVWGTFWNSKRRLMRGTRCFCISVNSADDT